MRTKGEYDWLDHTADPMIRIHGMEETDLYESGVLALTELIAELDSVETHELTVTVEGESVSGRLVAVLRELLYQFDVEGELLVAVSATLNGRFLTVSGRAVAFDPDRDRGLRELKAVTYHQLRSWSDDVGWHADVIFDV